MGDSKYLLFFNNCILKKISKILIENIIILKKELFLITLNLDL